MFSVLRSESENILCNQIQQLNQAKARK